MAAVSKVMTHKKIHDKNPMIARSHGRVTEAVDDLGSVMREHGQVSVSARLVVTALVLKNRV